MICLQTYIHRTTYTHTPTHIHESTHTLHIHMHPHHGTLLMSHGFSLLALHRRYYFVLLPIMRLFIHFYNTRGRVRITFVLRSGGPIALSTFQQACVVVCTVMVIKTFSLVFSGTENLQFFLPSLVPPLPCVCHSPSHTVKTCGFVYFWQLLFSFCFHKLSCWVYFFLLTLSLFSFRSTK